MTVVSCSPLLLPKAGRRSCEGGWPMNARVRMGRWKMSLAIGGAAVAVSLVGGPYFYIHFIEGSAPAPLTLATPSATSSAARTTSSGQATGASDGTWKVSSDSVVGYRVKEVLFGQSNVAVGRTNSISGSMKVSGTTVTAATFAVDMTTVASDQSRRDGQFNGRIMETSTYPTATFKLTEPIDLGAIPAEGPSQTFQAKGELTMHGVTKAVTFQLTGQYTGSTVQ